jgi:carbonic anhydrase
MAMTFQPRWTAGRRNFLRGSFAAAACSLAGSTAQLLAPLPASAKGPSSRPDSALQELLGGNRRYRDGRLTACSADLATLRRQTLGKQAPFAAILGCADSRVPVELVFDQSIGRLFVTRVAGNLASAEIIASLEYGVAALGTKLIMVLGHAHCGAVEATLKAEEVPGMISALYPHIQPAVDKSGGDLEKAIKMNAALQAQTLRQASPVIAKAVKAGEVEVLAAYYDLASGRVTVLQ